ncbi:MAG: hypothetical protein R2867_01530 [Caldilineaceae bacterium]
MSQEFLISNDTINFKSNAKIAMNDFGQAIVAWESLEQDGHSTGIYARRISAGGSLIGDEFRANTFTDGAEVRPVCPSTAAAIL